PGTSFARHRFRRGRPPDLLVHREPNHCCGEWLGRNPLALYHWLAGRNRRQCPGAAATLPVGYRTLLRYGERAHRHSRPSIFCQSHRPRTVPHSAFGGIAALEISPMPPLGSFYGVVGVILLLFAGVAYFITRLLSAYVFLHALFGLLAIIVYLASAKDTLRTFLGERSTKYGASAALYTVLFFAILAVVNYLSARHHHRFDLTEAGVYSLSPQSPGILQHLDKPLVINAFVEAGSDPQLKELLDSYRYASDKISYAIVDPDKQPDLAERFHISAVPAVHLQYGDHTNVVNKISEEELTNG